MIDLKNKRIVYYNSMGVRRRRGGYGGGRGTEGAVLFNQSLRLIVLGAQLAGRSSRHIACIVDPLMIFPYPRTALYWHPTPPLPHRAVTLS